MSGRRSHPRFDVNLASFGTLRVSKDIVVEHVGGHELVITSREPAGKDENLLLHLPDADPCSALSVTVEDSRPVVLRGSVRYRVQLRINGPDDRSSRTHGLPSPSEDGTNE